MKITPYPTLEAMYRAAALELGRAFAPRQGGRVALSGGATPLGWFDYLARHWTPPGNGPAEFYWVDERLVDASSPDSNFGNARRRWLGELARRNNQVRLHPLDPAHLGDYPDGIEFDQVWLGIGPDGHTASWFPGRDDYRNSGPVTEVAPPETAGPKLPRLTLTLAPVAAARRINLMFTGAAKLDLARRSLEAERPDPALPLSALLPVRDRIRVFYSAPKK